MKKIFKKVLTNENGWCIIGTSILFFESEDTDHVAPGKQARRSARCKLNFIKYLIILNKLWINGFISYIYYKLNKEYLTMS